MNYSPETQLSEFSLEGRFLAFVVDGGKLKYLRLSVAEGEIQIKLSKQVRSALYQALEQSPSGVLQPWDTIQIVGKTKVDRDTGEAKRVAHQITRLQTASTEQPECNRACRDKKVKLLVCQKSSCQKKGGKRQRQAIEAALCTQGLQHLVVIEETGCLGKCSMAPNIVLTPGKKRLSGMKPEAIVELLKTLENRRVEKTKMQN
jgi:(2Fe-2S) ferredoxin